MKELNRRDFIKGSTAATVSVATIARGISLTTFADGPKESAPVTNEKRWGLLIDTNRLSEADIDNMVHACQEEQGWGDEAHSKGDQVRSPSPSLRQLRPSLAGDSAPRRDDDGSFRISD